MPDFPNDIDPGQFYEGGGKPIQNPEFDRVFGPEVSQGLQEQLQVFKEQLHPSADVIYYPSCGVDTTVSSVFPDSHIIYVDMNPTVVNMLKQHGYEAYEADVNNFIPSSFPDITLIENPQVSAEKLVSVLKNSGYLVCNNYHGTANELEQNKDFEIHGVIVRNREGKMVMETQDLEDYFTSISTDEELRKLRMGWGSTLTYDSAVSLIKELGDKDAFAKIEAGKSTVLEEYKKLGEKYKDKIIHGSGVISWADINGRFYMIETKLPVKKGVADDMFVFRKKAKKEK